MGGRSIYEVDGYGDIAKPVNTPIEPDSYLEDVFFQTRPEVIDFDRRNPEERNPFYQVRDDFEIQDQQFDDFRHTLSPEQWDHQEPQLVKPKYRNTERPKSRDSSIRKIVSEHRFARDAFEISLSEFFPLHGIRTAKTLNDLLRATRYFKIKQRGKRCTVVPVESDPRNKKWTFKVKGHEKWSKPYPHEVRIQLLDDPKIKDIRQLKVLVTCSCQFWRYYGPDFNAQTQRYLLGPPRRDTGKGPPNERDPKRVNLICKHVWAIGQVVLEYAHKNKLDTFEQVDTILESVNKMKRDPEKLADTLEKINDKLNTTEKRQLTPIIDKLEKETSPTKVKDLEQKAIDSLQDILDNKDEGFLSKLISSIFSGVKKFFKRKSFENRKPCVANVLEIYFNETREE